VPRRKPRTVVDIIVDIISITRHPTGAGGSRAGASARTADEQLCLLDDLPGLIAAARPYDGERVPPLALSYRDLRLAVLGLAELAAMLQGMHYADAGYRSSVARVRALERRLLAVLWQRHRGGGDA